MQGTLGIVSSPAMSGIVLGATTPKVPQVWEDNLPDPKQQGEGRGREKINGVGASALACQSYPLS